MDEYVEEIDQLKIDVAQLNEENDKLDAGVKIDLQINAWMHQTEISLYNVNPSHDTTFLYSSLCK